MTTTKLIAHFDRSGRIHSLISLHNAPDGASVSLAPAAGEQVAEVDASTLGVSDFTAEKLREAANAHTISDPVLKRALMKKR